MPIKKIMLSPMPLMKQFVATLAIHQIVILALLESSVKTHLLSKFLCPQKIVSNYIFVKA